MLIFVKTIPAYASDTDIFSFELYSFTDDEHFYSIHEKLEQRVKSP